MSAVGSKFTCPSCGTTLKTAAPVPVGKLIKCPKCASTFAAGASNGHGPGPRPALAKAVQKVQRGAVPPAADEVDDDDELEDRPLRKKKKKKLKRKSSANPAALWGGIAGGVVALGLVAFLVYWFGIRDDRPAVELPANAQIAGGAQPLVPDLGRPGRSPLTSSRPTHSTGTNLAAGGQGMPFDLSQINLATINFGNLDAKDPATVDLWKYVPADSLFVFGLDAGNLMTIPAVSTFMDGILAQAGGNQADEFLKTAGLGPKDFEYLVAGLKMNLALVQQGSPEGIEQVTTGLRFKKPFDRQKLLGAFKAGPAKRAGSQEYYPVPPITNQQQGATLNGAIQLVGDRTVVVHAYNQSRPEPELPNPGAPGLAMIEGQLRGLGKAHAWVVVPFSDAIRGQIAMGVGQAAATVPPEFKPLLDAVAQGQGAGLALRLQGRAVHLTAALTCIDADVGMLMAKTLSQLWTQFKPNIGAFAAMIPPDAKPLVDEVVNSLQFRNQGATATASLQFNAGSLQGLTKLAQGGLAGFGGPGGAGGFPDGPPGGFPGGPPGGFPGGGFQPGNIPGQPGGFPGRAPGIQPGNIPGFQPGNIPGAPGRPPGLPGAPSGARPNQPGGRPGADAGAPGRELVIGEPAPEIEGEDTDGVPFKLSDYKGKVVLLDFWGHW